MSAQAIVAGACWHRARAVYDPYEPRNDKGHLTAPPDSMGLEACHRCLGPAWGLTQVLNAPFGNNVNIRATASKVKIA